MPRLWLFDGRARGLRVMMTLSGVPAQISCAWRSCILMYNGIEDSRQSVGKNTSPTIFQIGSYRFFFNGREEARRHVHIQTIEGVAKFWIEPTIALASPHGLSAKVLRKLDQLIREHEHEIDTAWDKHFQSGH